MCLPGGSQEMRIEILSFRFGVFDSERRELAVKSIGTDNLKFNV
jgi:hypothetical protein